MIRAAALVLCLAASPALADRAPPSIPGGLTDAEAGAFALAVGKCWNAAALPPAAQAIGVTVALSIDGDRRPLPGTIRLLHHVPDTAPGPDVSAAYEAARRAILRCGAAGFDLPADKRTVWSATEITFPGGITR